MSTIYDMTPYLPLWPHHPSFPSLPIKRQTGIGERPCSLYQASVSPSSPRPSSCRALRSKYRRRAAAIESSVLRRRARSSISRRRASRRSCSRSCASATAAAPSAVSSLRRRFRDGLWDEEELLPLVRWISSS
eukprot:gb/GECH01004706.1/.p1 GENE.gb/GECH01004706.1/~~gb/GECH01004706.1/.p1  ORF type:complete len:133 (+),score=26.77 gb/GECH01004706.1/:1-399(+)